MHVLALDTSTMIQSVATVRSNGHAVSRTFHAGKGHTASLLSSISAVLADNDLRPEQLGLAAIGLGPGSFTGLRIGVAAIKAFCYTTGTPVVGVSSLAALARRGAPRSELVLTAVDARKKEVYGALWRVAAGTAPVEIVKTSTYSAAELSRLTSQVSEPIEGLGTGIDVYSEIFEDTLGNQLTVGPQDMWHPLAADIADLAIMAFSERGADPLVELEPAYIRPSEAELNWKGKP